ncbi:MAG TPA: D-alanine--D-alanine ligase [Egibacteraceae bacterium]|nr:D-alanine--D-alanine ligase [Egibacteraceae bacterium]
MKPLRVAVLAGGLSLEREVSLRSGRRVAEALADRGHRVVSLDLDDRLAGALTGGDFDVAYLALHGKAGEDGTIQALLELLEVPYTGPDALASALAWDKALMKGLWRRAGLPTPDWVSMSSGAIRDMGAARALDRVEARLGCPLIVKPSQGGAAMGVRYVDAPEDLTAALVASYSYHDVVLVERFVDGAEVAVSVIDGQALPPVEVVPRTGHYDFSARYTHGATEFFAPARLTDTALGRCRETAVRAYQIAGCRHVARADLIVDRVGVPWLLELDTCPGMTETSLLPMAAEAAGWEFGELCERVVALAVAGSNLQDPTSATRPATR